MEASALPAQVGLTRTRMAIGAPLLRLRSDEQLVSLFRAGSDDAFRVIHDRYRQRLHAYTRQMLSGSPVDPEDTVQEIFVRAYAGLRVGERRLALRAWLYRVAHNRCIDELRRPQAMACEWLSDALASRAGDPIVSLEQRDALQRLIVDVRRLPEQQRSALLMRELGGMTYRDVAGALGVSVPAVKSLLVRARIGLAQANQARDTACAEIRADLVVAHDRGVRSSGLARRHMRDCAGCRQFRTEIRGVSRRFAALVPALGPLGVLAKCLGLGGAGSGGAAAGGTAVTGSGVTATGMTATGAIGATGATAGAAAGAGHVVTLLAAALATAGGAIELQHIAHHAVAPLVGHHRHAARGSRSAVAPGAAAAPVAAIRLVTVQPGVATARPLSVASAARSRLASPATRSRRAGAAAGAGDSTRALSLTETMNPDHLPFSTTPAGSVTGSSTGIVSATGTSPSSAPGTTTAGGVPPAGSSPVQSPGATGSPGTASPGSAGTPAGSSPSTGTPTSGSSSGPGSNGAAGSPSGSGQGPSPAATTDSRSSSSASSSPSGGASRGSKGGTVAVFTVTGN